MGCKESNQQNKQTNHFLVVCTEKQYSENVSLYVFDNNTRLNINQFTGMLEMQDNTGISFCIVST